jgi:Ni/Fe-hydrogenase subunit HybB-like protein
MLMVTGWIVTYSYAIEIFIAWYSGNGFERYVHLVNRPTGPYAAVFWVMIGCNCCTPQIFWSKKMRTNTTVLFIASILINIGMWTERFILIVTSEMRDFLTSSWHMYKPTYIDLSRSSSARCRSSRSLFLLFLRFVPFIPVSELKELKFELRKEERGGHA